VLEYEFEIADFTKMLGLEMSGRFYTEVKDLLKGMISKVMWMTLEDGTETTVNWVQKAWTNKRSGKAKIRVDEDLVPYLFDLKARYLSYGLRNILVMKSHYSIRIYEILKAQYDMKIAQTDKRTEPEKKFNPRTIVWNIGLDELKKKLMVENIKSYDDYSLFRIKVLEVAEREINELTDMNITATAIKKGRKTVGVEFKMTAKNRAEKQALNMAVDDEFDDDVMDGQADLFDL
jgi:plasmid replication initiation protein